MQPNGSNGFVLLLNAMSDSLSYFLMLEVNEGDDESEEVTDSLLLLKLLVLNGCRIITAVVAYTF